MKKQQMTVKPQKVYTGASSTMAKQWQDISWPSVEASVHRLQMRIAKAAREGRYGKVKSLQWPNALALSKINCSETSGAK